MKRILFCLGLFIFMAGAFTSKAQSVIDAEDDNNFNNFYTKTLTKEKRAMPYAYLRENDVVWETAVWRTIDFREKFNQFFYFPIYRPNSPSENQQGRASLVKVLMKAFEDGAIECYKDDDLLIPIDYEEMMKSITGTHTISYDIYDEWDEVIGSVDTVITEEFDPSEVYSCKIKEYWYIDKQDTRQKVRITGLCLMYNQCKDRDGDRECNTFPLFWVPMNDMRVRNVLVTYNCFDENNINAERTYDDVFITRYFDSFVTRESNRFNRQISDYLTGTDAIMESLNVEDKLFNLESDMWEY